MLTYVEVAIYWSWIQIECIDVCVYRSDKRVGYGRKYYGVSITSYLRLARYAKDVGLAITEVQHI